MNASPEMASTESLILERLPNEILVTILDHLPLKELLKATIICRQIHILAVHTLQLRLRAVSSIPSHELILECYHPSLKISTPYLSCRYLGTRHPTDCEDDCAAQKDCSDLHHVCQLYASFRPVVTEENRRRRFRMVWPVSVQGGAPAGFDSDDEVATQDLHLDNGELFSQLCVALNLVTLGRHAGVFVSHYNMSEHVVRVFRHWLSDMAAAGSSSGGQPWNAAAKIPIASDRILWVDAARTIGLRFHVSVGPAERMPLLSGQDEDPAVSYGLAYEELLIRSTSLLMAVEASTSKELEPSRNSIILSSAPT
ncbi:Cyclin-like F-box [Akanthomyces lecanii RCEF 1005]|uniref:Cyclin-like F-box n=1 Tax=Akanthomyces lecanii RCEF 1005 TaxID=1081108 RepID=A0A168GPA8_CORDF|nr:Cyclin-like F-box [Akanthomyces lecanii RCEF 1005]